VDSAVRLAGSFVLIANLTFEETESMSRSSQAAGILIVAMFGLWGCTRAPSADNGSAATAEKLKALETKMARLEDDFRAASSARDQLSKKLIAAEEARMALEVQLANRTNERDQVSTQYKSFRDGLRDLLAKGDEGKMEGSPTVPVIPASNIKPELPALPIPSSDK
jgi:septal ring factor EnvC (AmiA/AmiB activator)